MRAAVFYDVEYSRLEDVREPEIGARDVPDLIVFNKADLTAVA